jgi:hypothetical protein
LSQSKPDDYWQKKATYRNIANTVPDFEHIEPGSSMMFHDENGEPSLEVKVSPNSVFVSQFSDVVDYLESKLKEKPSSQIIQESTPQELTTIAMYAILDCVCRCMNDSGKGLNDLLNNHNDIEIIDHKNNEVHRLSGTMKNEQLKFKFSKSLDSDFEMPKPGRMPEGKFSERSFSFPEFLNKLSTDLKPRFDTFREPELA